MLSIAILALISEFESYFLVYAIVFGFLIKKYTRW